MVLITSIYHTPWGMLKVEHDEHFIYQSSFTAAAKKWIADSTLAHLIDDELKKYSNNSQHQFNLPLKREGTAFQINLYQALLDIPSGKTMTYGELAHQLNSSPRAIGQGCKRNRLPLFIPCHRVLGKNSLGGYMGVPEAITYKALLLTHEKADCQLERSLFQL